jgi:hypothetical protein
MNALRYELFFMSFCFVVFVFLSLFLDDVFGVFSLGLMKFPEGCGVLGAFLRRIGCKFRAASGAACFHFFAFLVGERGNLSRMNFSTFFGFFLFVGKLSAANEGIGFRFCGGFFVFSFHKVSGQGSHLIFAELRIVLRVGEFLSDWRFRRVGFSGALGMAFGLCAPVSQEPAGQPAGEAARNIGATWASGRDTARRPGRKVFWGGLLVMPFALRGRRWRRRCYRFAAILRK